MHSVIHGLYLGEFTLNIIMTNQEKEKLSRKQLLSEVQRNNRKQICVIQIKK